MTATVDELCTLLESGWTPEQINRLVLVRWLLTQGYNGNLLLTQELLRHRITNPSTPSLSSSAGARETGRRSGETNGKEGTA